MTSRRDKIHAVIGALLGALIAVAGTLGVATGYDCTPAAPPAAAEPPQ